MTFSLESTLNFFHYILVTGALEKGGTWGGPECRQALSEKIHFFESIAWLSLCLVIVIVLRPLKTIRHHNHLIREEIKHSRLSSSQRFVEVALGSLHMIMYLQIIYYKINIMSLINLLQPCHLILLLQGLALLYDGVMAVNITIFLLPALTGTLLAMLFPETGGLDQFFEAESYWIQHVLIQLLPLYLLARRDFLALGHANLFSTQVGLLILMFLHFSLYEVIDWYLGVNVEFMLCPTGPMVEIFSHLPSILTQPSYRSTLTLAVLIVGNVVAFVYIQIASLIRSIVGKAHKTKSG